MKKITKAKVKIFAKSFFIILIFFLSVQAIAEWREVAPGVVAPDGGYPPPLNTGTVSQQKNSALALSGLVNFSTTILKSNLTVDGNVGIGTTTPTAKLEVVGPFKLSDGTEGSGNILISTADGSASWTSPAVFQTPWVQPVFTNNNTLYGGSSASSRLTLESTSDSLKGFIILNPTGGNVGIGTQNPGQKLTVVGNLQVSGSFMPGGQDGVSGQVLTSNGIGLAPAWTTLPNYAQTIQQLQTAVADLQARVNALEAAQP